MKTLREWIDAGLPWEAGFTFAARDYEPPLRPRRPELPPAVDGRTNPVDRILDAYLQTAQVSPGRRRSMTRRFLRRVYLDIDRPAAHARAIARVSGRQRPGQARNS